MSKEWPLKTFIEKLAEDSGWKYAGQLDDFVQRSLETKVFGRMIVWSALNKHFLIGRVLSRIVRLEVQIQKTPNHMETIWRVIYAGKSIAEAKHNFLLEAKHNFLLEVIL